MFDAAIAQLGDDGESDEAVRSFDSVADVRQLLTDCRVELMRSIMTASPDSITISPTALVATIPDVHSDVQVLADHHIVYFDTDGRTKRPVILHNRVRVDIEVVGDSGTERAHA